MFGRDLGRWESRFLSPLPSAGLLDNGLVEPLLSLGEGIPCKIDGNP